VRAQHARGLDGEPRQRIVGERVRAADA